METGSRLGENDNWLAAFCRCRGQPLISRDQAFDRVRGLRRLPYERPMVGLQLSTFSVPFLSYQVSAFILPEVRPYFGSITVNPFTWEKCRRLNVARSLPRSKAVAPTITS